ncbi:drug/metabolite transporter permease [Klebsiella variicola]|nr:drug/metabolite transporter permease [Klebsiella variicola]
MSGIMNKDIPPIATRKKRYRGYGLWLMLTLMVVLWGLSWPAMKIALHDIPPLWLGTLRFFTAGLCLFIVVGCKKQLAIPSRKDLPIVISVGGLQMLAFTALGLVAMQYTDVSRAALLAYTTPLWGVLFAWLINKSLPQKKQLVALCIGIVGIAIICSPLEIDWSQQGMVKGNLFLLLAALCWSVVIFHVKKHQWHLSPLALAPWQMLFATIPMLLLAVKYEGWPREIHWSPLLCALIFFIGPIATSVCFVISTACGRKVSSFTMSNFTLGVPVIGVISSVFFLGSHLTFVFLSGLILVFSGAVMAIAFSFRDA